MDTTDKDDKLLKQFFAEQKQQIPDDGFSQRVMQQIIRKQQRTSYSNAMAGVIMVSLLFFYTGAGKAFGNYTAKTMQQIILSPEAQMNALGITLSVVAAALIFLYQYRQVD